MAVLYNFEYRTEVKYLVYRISFKTDCQLPCRLCCYIYLDGFAFGALEAAHRFGGAKNIAARHDLFDPSS